jgi:hypothetical protein
VGGQGADKAVRRAGRDDFIARLRVGNDVDLNVLGMSGVHDRARNIARDTQPHVNRDPGARSQGRQPIRGLVRARRLARRQHKRVTRPALRQKPAQSRRCTAGRRHTWDDLVGNARRHKRIDNVAGALQVGFYNDNFKVIQHELPLRTLTAPLLSAGGFFTHQRRNLHKIALF